MRPGRLEVSIELCSRPAQRCLSPTCSWTTLVSSSPSAFSSHLFLLRCDLLLRRRFCLLLRRRLCLLLLRRCLRLLLRRLLLRHLLLLLDFLDDDGSFLRASFLLRFRPRKRRLEAFRRFTRPVLCLKEKILRFSLIEVMNALTRGNQERRRRRKRRDLNSKSHAKENARTTMRTKITNAFASFARKISPSRENADLVCGSSFSFASTRWFSSLVKALLADKTPPPPEEEKVEVLFFLMDVVASSSRLASFSIAVSMLRTIESSFWMRISGDTVDITFVCCVCVCTICA